MSNRFQEALIISFVALVCFSLDQSSKFFALAHLSESGNVNLIPGFFDLTLRFNTGAAFSLFSNMSLSFFLLISAAAICALLYYVVTLETGHMPQIVGLGAILGGAMGNLLDRVRLGSVVDFLLFYVKAVAWPVFNLADVAIVCGVALFLWDNFRNPAKSGNEGTA